MKPKPLVLLNHFTVPIGIAKISVMVGRRVYPRGASVFVQDRHR
jgi:hypothetical protein